MPEQNIFRWMDGRGWLILSGRLTPDGADVGDIRSLVLARSAADGAVACVALSGDVSAAERLLDDLEELGAPSGYVVDLVTEDDLTITKRLSEASVIVLDSAPDAGTARSLLLGAPIEGIQTAFENGGMILAEGHSAAVFGTWVRTQEGGVTNGMEWLEGAVVFATDHPVGGVARTVLELQPHGYAVGIGSGSALALGPDGEVQVWGRGQVSVALGSAYVEQ